MSKIILNLDALLVDSFELDPVSSADLAGNVYGTWELHCQNHTEFPWAYTCGGDHSCVRGYCDY